MKRAIPIRGIGMALCAETRRMDMEKRMKTNQVTVKQGIAEGVDCGTYTVFKGIPYAKPPVGELRFQAPREPEKWDGVYRADHFAKIAVQDLPKAGDPFTGRYAKEFYSDPKFLPQMSEDCLYLNIWVPKAEKGEKFPVAFWIHGGGFGGGYSSEIEFDGKAYCERGVILISVEYRVNIFGFLAHPWLSAESERGISGNYGILDQIAALGWTYENIAAFGGDPERITVFGQSAGSMSTQVLVSSDLSEKMIAGAVMQSGVSCEEDLLATPTLMEEEAFGEMFVELTGAKNLEELRTLPAEQLMSAKRMFDARMWETGKGLVMVPNVDGYVLKQSVKELWKEGRMKNIPYMLGVVTDDLGAAREDVEAGITGKLMEECRRWSIQCRSVYGNPSYLYHFSHKLPGDDWGAFHSAELWYMFGTFGRSWRPMKEEDRKLSEEMIVYWTNFIKTGKPGDAGTEIWEAYTADGGYVKEFR